MNDTAIHGDPIAVGIDLDAHVPYHALVDAHPPGRDEAVRTTAGSHTSLGQEFIESHEDVEARVER